MGFCTSTTPIPAEGRDFRVVSSALPRRPNRKRNSSQVLHLLDHALDPRRGSSEHLKSQKTMGHLATPIIAEESLQGEIAKNHWVSLHLDHADPRRGSIASVVSLHYPAALRRDFNSSCKDSLLQGVIARSRKCIARSQRSHAIASCKTPCKEPSASKGTHGAKLQLDDSSARLLASDGVKCKCTPCKTPCNEPSARTPSARTPSCKTPCNDSLQWSQVARLQVLAMTPCNDSLQ